MDSIEREKESYGRGMYSEVDEIPEWTGLDDPKHKANPASVFRYKHAFDYCAKNKDSNEIVHQTYDELCADILNGIENGGLTLAGAKERIAIIRRFNDLNVDFWYD